MRRKMTFGGRGNICYIRQQQKKAEWKKQTQTSERTNKLK